MRKGLVSSFLAFAILASPNISRAQVAELAGAAATNQVINTISEKLNGLIDNARQSGDFLAMRAAQEALYILDAFKATSGEIISTTFDKIGKERQSVLNALNKTAYDIENGRIDTLERLQATGDQFDRLARDVTFKDFPVLYRYRGTIVTPGENGDVRVTIDGHRLTRGSPYILFRDAKYAAKIDGESLRFEFPRSIFKEEPDKAKFEDATLVVENREGGFFGINKRVGEKRYDIGFVTLPTTVASVKATYKEEFDVPQERPFSQEVHHDSSSRSYNCRPYIYSPSMSSGRFDVSRSSVTPTTGNRDGHIRNVQVREVGISFEICARRPIFARGNGFRHAVVNYVEVWTVQGSKDNSVEQVLNWTSSSTIEVPERRKELLIEVKDFSGISRVVTEAGGKAGKFAEVRFDPHANVVIVDPVRPAFLNAL